MAAKNELLEPLEPPPSIHPPGEKSESASQRSPWRTGLLLTTSAVLGGIAVAIWNRRTLARMRQEHEGRGNASQSSDEGME